MKRRTWFFFLKSAWLIVFVLCVSGILSRRNVTYSQGRQESGRSIGTITTQGDLIVMTLNDGVFGKANMFDLARRTVRFSPEGAGYRAENLTLQWDSEFGKEMSGPQLTLHNFSFPYSGKSWDSFSVGVTGSISFGAAQNTPSGGGFGGARGGGVSVDRFAQLQDAARTLINTGPAICVFFKPRMSGTRYVKELADRIVITWHLSRLAGSKTSRGRQQSIASKQCCGRMERLRCPTIGWRRRMQLSGCTRWLQPAQKKRSRRSAMRRRRMLLHTSISRM